MSCPLSVLPNTFGREHKYFALSKSTLSTSIPLDETFLRCSFSFFSTFFFLLLILLFLSHVVSRVKSPFFKYISLPFSFWPSSLGSAKLYWAAALALDKGLVVAFGIIWTSYKTPPLKLFLKLSSPLEHNLHFRSIASLSSLSKIKALNFHLISLILLNFSFL